MRDALQPFGDLPDILVEIRHHKAARAAIDRDVEADASRASTGQGPAPTRCSPLLLNDLILICTNRQAGRLNIAINGGSAAL